MTNLVRIAIPVPLHQTYDYRLGDNQHFIRGARVRIEFGRRSLIGIMLLQPEQSDVPVEKLKSIVEVLDDKPLFSDEMWNLLNWASRYYVHPLGEVLFNALPVLLRQGEPCQHKSIDVWQLTDEGKSLLAIGLESQNLVKTSKQKALLNLLSIQPFTPKSLKDHDISSTICNQLANKGLIERATQLPEMYEWSASSVAHSTNQNAQLPIQLNREQATAVGAISSQINQFGSWLLYGITGSGKTEVYLTLLEKILSAGKQALVLIPEIGLTPQTVQRFRSRFNVPVDLLHSAINDQERLGVWLRARENQSAIVIGTRSALFTPFANLGMIIIDEEHDNSFKQHDGFRYHARDLAILRARNLNIPIILGSATPSLESLHNAKTGKSYLLRLTHRAGSALLPEQSVIDMKHQTLEAGLSPELITHINTHLNAGNQVMLFLNRRGYSPALLCHECGWAAECQRCERFYTLHQHAQQLRCHHCDHQKRLPVQCPECGSTQLMPAGFGTEQLEEKLAEKFLNVPISRIDRDSTRKKGSLEKELAEIHQGGARIIVGTQMLAKGHHFSDVTLVALLDVDGALFSSDFRAAEQFAQLFTQVAGRAGRASKRGQVLLQTHHPEHPWLQLLLKEGYEGLSQQLLTEREQTYLPPFSHHAFLRAEAANSQIAHSFLTQVRNQMRALQQPDSQLWLLGPIPSIIPKRSGRYRWQLLLQHANRTGLHQQLIQLAQIIEQQPLLKQVKWSLDIDPLES